MAEKKMANKPVAKKRRAKKHIVKGIAHIQTTANNALITISDEQGNVICQSSSGALGYKGSRKSTPFAAQEAAKVAATKAKEQGLSTVKVEIKGSGQGRESAIRAFGEAGITVTEIKDVSPIPHNGCRPPKRRRI